MTPNDNTGTVFTKRPAGKQTILALTFNEREAESLRRMACGITIKKDKHPSMSLLARYGLRLLEDSLERDREDITAALAKMVTPVPQPALRNKRKAAVGNLDLRIPT